VNDTRPHAMVVGASSGIGHSIAQRLSATHQVTAMARRFDRIKHSQDTRIESVACDVSKLDSIAPLVEAAVAEHGKLCKLVYCVGLQSIKPMRSLKVNEIQDSINVNLTAAIIFARLFASQRISKSEAVFCAISSIAAQRPEVGIVTYSVAKAGIDALIKGLAKECGPRRAVGVAPGWLDTEMTQSFPQIYNDAFKERLLGEAPSGIATVDDITDMAVFLMSDQCGKITGQIITVDGGASL
jgi:NAD(P)-dependent dehydrogenase (short-subunit alcohol dehydrogenase family)